MNDQPVLLTERLVLRPLEPRDAATVLRMYRSREIAGGIYWVFEPRSERRVRQWILQTPDHFAAGESAEFGVELKAGAGLVGLAGLDQIARQDCRADLWFVTAVSSWGKGYATEAGRALLRYGFEDLRLNRIHAHSLARNAASRRVLTKLGMKEEGVLRQHAKIGTRFLDVVIMAVLRQDWTDRPQE